MEEANIIRKNLHKTALSAPPSSGVYLWKDETERVIYVGKAVNLKKRLSSYFSGQKDVKTRVLITRAASIEYIVTGNEYEAFILENNLIKQYAPKYNISLKDGKSYPFIRIANEPFPAIFKTRRLVDDGSKYYGPFPNVGAVENFLEMIEKYYKIRKCKKLSARSSPCLYYHIGRCAAPCCKKITRAEYAQIIDQVVDLLEGTEKIASADEKILSLKKRMEAAAEELRFEEAARLRDGIRAVSDLREQNAVEDLDPESRDYIAYAANGAMASFAVLHMRGGRMTGRDLYRAVSLNDEEELLPQFLLSYYDDSREIPSKIFVPTNEGLSLTRRWFSQEKGENPEISVPTEKKHTAAMSMAMFNAREDASRRLRERGDFPALEELRAVLNLNAVPERIEGFDVAHINGRFPVVGMVSFKNGNPDKKNYRYFRLRSTDGIIDDFASLKEAVSRRYTRLLNESNELPDLILIDGGLGQLNSVLSILRALKLEIPAIALAKRDEEIYIPDRAEPLRLPRRSDALRLLQRVRDETHRFSTSLNQRLRTKENVVSVFENINGIGTQKAKILLRRFNSLEDLCDAKAEEIASALRCPINRAEKILEESSSLLKKRREEILRRQTTDTAGKAIPANAEIGGANALYSERPQHSQESEAAEPNVSYASALAAEITRKKRREQ